MITKKLITILILTAVCYASFSQKLSPEELFGEWKIKQWFFFEKLNETKEEYNDRMKEVTECLKNKVIINNSGIEIQGNSECGFAPCPTNLLIGPQYFEKKIIEDNEYTRREQGAEMIDSNVVGKKFVSYLDKSYSKSTLVLLDAKCTQSYGDYTMKICLINKNRIGFFFGEELWVLDRIKK